MLHPLFRETRDLVPTSGNVRVFGP